MRFADVGPHPYVRFGDADQRADFAGVIHPQFDDGNLRPLPQLDERQRQPDVVVEVPAVADDAVPRREKLRRHFLRRRLAGAAGDRHDLRARLAPHRLRQRLQRRDRVVDLDDGDGRRPLGAASSRRPRPRATTTPAAPASIAAAAKSAPSNRSPRIATNSSPGVSVRVSIETPAELDARRRPRRPAHRAGDPAGSQCPAAGGPDSPVQRRARPDPRRPTSVTVIRRPSWSAVSRAPRAPPPRRRTAARGRRSPGTSRGPCRRPARRRLAAPARSPWQSPRADRRSTAAAAPLSRRVSGVMPR